MTIEELLEELNKVPKEKQKLPIYVFDYKTTDNIKVDSISLFDNDKEHDEINTLSININSKHY